MTALPRRLRGFALVLALFLIVSLAAIGAYLVTVSNVQVESTAKDELGARAYQAARAGLEWGAYRVLRDTNCAPGPVVIAFATVELAGFQAEVTCEDFGPETEGAGTVNTFPSPRKQQDWWRSWPNKRAKPAKPPSRNRPRS